MPDPNRPLPAERPDPAALLIDAVIQRQQPLALRLAQQWVHRRGWSNFEAFLNGSLLHSCGAEAIGWLRQGLDLATGAGSPRLSADPGKGLPGFIREALSEALAPLREPAAVAPATSPAEDPWQLPLLETSSSQVGASPNLKAPAPPPADLASLRAWLNSDAA